MLLRRKNRRGERNIIPNVRRIFFFFGRFGFKCYSGWSCFLFFFLLVRTLMRFLPFLNQINLTIILVIYLQFLEQDRLLPPRNQRQWFHLCFLLLLLFPLPLPLRIPFANNPITLTHCLSLLLLLLILFLLFLPLLSKINVSNPIDPCNLFDLALLCLLKCLTECLWDHSLLEVVPLDLLPWGFLRADEVLQLVLLLHYFGVVSMNIFIDLFSVFGLIKEVF